MLTVRVYRRDRRFRDGERLVTQRDHSTEDRAAIDQVYAQSYPQSQGYRWEIFQTWVTRRNAMSGQQFRERFDTPYYASPSSETYWSS